ncbi:MAG: AMP-binding protein, partial [Cyanobacteria bacterium P01_D01_bin.71]
LDDIALLQYTSGSTSQPRGVMVSHRNLMHNLALIHERFGHSHDSRGVIWLPPHHDMGLIGGVLQPLYGGFPVTLMSPTTFLRQPRRWLQAVSVFGGTTSGGPNFAYERCLQRITPEQRRGLDLSHWELAFTGAEPVQAKTLDQFAEAFADCGFRKAAFYPCYGLAEATLFVSGGTKFTEPTSCAVDRVALAQGRVVTSPAETALPLVSCGQAAADQSILIVDAQTHQPCDADQIGEIWLAGPSVAQGYWHQGEATQEIFEAQLADGSGPFLRTGDLGFWRRGELFVTGRLKDLIIIRGQNHYPQDIEQTAAHSHEALRRQAGAAFSVEIAGKERLILVQEVQRTALRSLNTKAVIEAIRAAVSRRHGLQIYGVVLLKPGSLPKTTSGKVQRHACKAQFQDGALAAVGQWQVAQSPVASPLSTPMSPAEQPSLSWQDLQDYNQFAAWPTNSPSAASTPSNINASGDIEQSLAGEKATLDMQLRQKPVHYSPNAKSLERWLIQWLAQRLQISAADMDTHKAFADYGVDSVMAVELAQDLEELLRLQQSLDVTLAWNFPTIAALAAHLAIDASAQTAQNLADAATERRDSELVKVDATDFQSSTLNSPHEAPALDDLSEAEMAKVLAAELAALSGRKA